MDHKSALPQPSHSQILNDSIEAFDRAFLCFQLLPEELRLQIWHLASIRERLIILDIRHDGAAPETAASHDDTTSATRRPYVVHTSHPGEPHPLLSVNVESRRVFLKVFRVTIPCRYASRSYGSYWPHAEPAGVPGVLHLNPETDHLHLKAQLPVKDTLHSFLDDLKLKYDPLSVGLLHLVLETANVSASRWFTPIGDHGQYSEAFKQTITQLRSVWFLLNPYFGRHTLDSLTPVQPDGASDIYKTHPNRSFPVLANTQVFSRLGPDPRNVTQDLENIFEGDPRLPPRGWHGRLMHWGVQPEKCDYRLLLTFNPGKVGQLITDRCSAMAFLRREEEVLREQRQMNGWDSGKSRVEMQLACGFWLFPLLGKRLEDDCSSNLKSVAVPWPELALFDLPESSDHYDNNMLPVA